MGEIKNQEICDLQKDKRYYINTSYVLREIAGEYAIIPIDEECLITNAVMTPNDSAVFLWKAFTQPSTIEEVIEKILAEYDVMKDQIEKDVKLFVDQSLRLRILEEEK